MDSRSPEEKQAQKDQLDYNLTNHTPHPNAIKRIEGLRSAGKAMGAAIIDMVPKGREQSMALTDLENMIMHAVAGIVRFETMDNPTFAAARKADEEKAAATPEK